jgi:hypothetical protein
MLGHESGMIGFPLRLLARENYDRIVQVKGASQVALITGEEKIAPPGARYSSAPSNPCRSTASCRSSPSTRCRWRPIPSAATSSPTGCSTPRHPRDHAAGRRHHPPVLNRLLPDIDVVARPRFSKLAYVGPKKATRLPRRSAVVGFSASEVYAIAELIRRQRAARRSSWAP